MAYATLEEYLRRLRLESPTAEATAAAQQQLDAAAGEIDTYLGYDQLETPPVHTDDQLALLAIVNLDRAQEHSRLTPFGALQQGPDLPPVLVARDSFYRHARKLASLKVSWGIG